MSAIYSCLSLHAILFSYLLSTPCTHPCYKHVAQLTEEFGFIPRRMVVKLRWTCLFDTVVDGFASYLICFPLLCNNGWWTQGNIVIIIVALWWLCYFNINKIDVCVKLVLGNTYISIWFGLKTECDSCLRILVFLFLRRLLFCLTVQVLSVFLMIR